MSLFATLSPNTKSLVNGFKEGASPSQNGRSSARLLAWESRQWTTHSSKSGRPTNLPSIPSGYQADAGFQVGKSQSHGYAAEFPLLIRSIMLLELIFLESRLGKSKKMSSSSSVAFLEDFYRFWDTSHHSVHEAALTRFLADSLLGACQISFRCTVFFSLLGT